MSTVAFQASHYISITRTVVLFSVSLASFALGGRELSERHVSIIILDNFSVLILRYSTLVYYTLPYPWPGLGQLKLVYAVIR